MKRMILACLALALTLASACTVPRQEGSATLESAPPVAEPETSPTPEPAPSDTYEPLALSRDVRAYEDGYIVYPRVFGGAAEAINASLYDEVALRAKELTSPIFSDYRVEYNDDGLFSVLIYVRDFKTDELLFLVPLTYDANTGAKLALSDLLDKRDDTWRRVLPDIVTEQAAQRNITLLSDLLPVEDGQEFYITANSLALVYRLYEIATYSAGTPEFRIPYSRISGYFGPDSPLWRIVGEEDG